MAEQVSKKLIILTGLNRLELYSLDLDIDQIVDSIKNKEV